MLLRRAETPRHSSEAKEKKGTLPQNLQELVDESRASLEGGHTSYTEMERLSDKLILEINDDENSYFLYRQVLKELRRMKRESRTLRREYDRLIVSIRRSREKLGRYDRRDTRQQLRALRRGRRMVSNTKNKNEQSRIDGLEVRRVAATEVAVKKEPLNRRAIRDQNRHSRRQRRRYRRDQKRLKRIVGRFGKEDEQGRTIQIGRKEKQARQRTTIAERRQQRRTTVNQRRSLAGLRNEQKRQAYKNDTLQRNTELKMVRQARKEERQLGRIDRRSARKDGRRLKRSARQTTRLARRARENPVEGHRRELAQLKAKVNRRRTIESRRPAPKNNPKARTIPSFKRPEVY